MDYDEELEWEEWLSLSEGQRDAKAYGRGTFRVLPRTESRTRMIKLTTREGIDVWVGLDALRRSTVSPGADGGSMILLLGSGRAPRQRVSLYHRAHG